MLWTPNPKTIEPVHLCPVCGGIRRRFHPAATRDHRRYFSFHRVCCCDCVIMGTCPTTMEATLEGFDSSYCTSCIQGISYDFKIRNLAIDGTYTLTRSSSSPCVYAYNNYTGTPPDFIVDRYSSFDGSCTTFLSASNTFVGIDASITNIGTGSCATIDYVLVRSMTTLQVAAFFYNAGSSGELVGQALSNNISVCGQTVQSTMKATCTVGQVTINLP